MSWTFDAPTGTYKNARLSDIIHHEMLRQDAEAQRAFQASSRTYHYAHGHRGMSGMTCRDCNPPIPLWRRLRARIDWWWYKHRPQFHLGPCPAEDE